MKINEKSLSKFAASGAPADKEGYLMKKGEVNRGYQKRWFVLKGNLLFYYERRTDRDPLGVIVLEGCTIELDENSDGFSFQIVFPGAASRIYVIGADSQEEMEAWMKVLSCGSYDYMKLMVSELQRQVDEMTTDSQKKLVKEADRLSKAIEGQYQSFSGSSFDMDDNFNASSTFSKTFDDHKVVKRFNPFDNGSDIESPPTQLSNNMFNFKDNSQITKTKSFIDLHEEYRQQIECLSELWKTSARTSVLLS